MFIVSVEPAERQDLSLLGLDLLRIGSDSNSGYETGISGTYIVLSSHWILVDRKVVNTFINENRLI